MQIDLRKRLRFLRSLTMLVVYIFLFTKMYEIIYFEKMNFLKLSQFFIRTLIFISFKIVRLYVPYLN